MPASRLQRLQLPQQRGSRALETTEPRILAKKSAQALDAGGASDVKIGATTNLDRLQVHRKWEISVKENLDAANSRGPDGYSHRWRGEDVIRKGAMHMEAQSVLGPALRHGLLLLILATLNSFSVAQEPAAEARKDELLRWFSGLEFPDVKGLRFVRFSSETQSLDGTKVTQHSFGFVTQETEETLAVFGLSLDEDECEKGAKLTRWSFPVEMRTAELGEYARSYLMFPDRRVRTEMSDYNIMDFGRISPCTEAVVLSWACERRGLHDLAAKLFARAEVEAREPESLYFARHLPTWDSLERLIERERKKYTKNPTLRQIVERDVSQLRAENLLGDLRYKHPTRPQLLARLEAFQRLFPNSNQAAPVPQTIAILRQMIEEDERAAHLRRDAVPFGRLDSEEQIAELIFQLRDQHGGTIDTPSCFVFYHDDNSPARQLARHGFDAVPQLIAALDDTRLTRAVGGGGEYVFTDRVLRVGDCAEQILARIAGRRSFADRTSPGAELMREGNASRTRSTVLEWFAIAQEKGELQVLSESVADGGFFCEGQAEILAIKHGKLGLPALVAGMQARATSQTSPETQWRLLRFVHRIPGEDATAYLIKQTRGDPAIVNRFVAAWGLHQRGNPEGVEAMVKLFDDDELVPTNAQNAPYSGNSFMTSEVIWFLLRCGKVAAIEAVARKIEQYDAIVLEQAILDIAFQRNTFYGGPDCVPDAAPEVVRDDTAVVREAQAKLLAELLDNKLALVPSNFGRGGDWEKWRYDARICDFAAAALARLDPDRFQFDIGAPEPKRDEQIARLKLLR